MASDVVLLFSWDRESTPPKQHKLNAQRISPKAAEYVREFIEHFDANLPEVPPEMPTRRSEEKIRLAQTAEKASVYLTLQVLFRFSGSIGLLLDCQSLLFSGCVHVLLPELDARSMVDEKGLLLNSLWMHVKLAWDEEPAHKYFLLGQFFEAIEMRERALQAMHKSL